MQRRTLGELVRPVESNFWEILENGLYGSIAVTLTIFLYAYYLVNTLNAGNTSS
jgi:hypothetical protein